MLQDLSFKMDAFIKDLGFSSVLQSVLQAIEGFSWLFGTVILKCLMCLIFGISDDVSKKNYCFICLV